MFFISHSIPNFLFRLSSLKASIIGLVIFITHFSIYFSIFHVALKLITIAKQGLVEKFYTEELELRHSLSYPPFSSFILISWQDTKEAVMKTEKKLGIMFGDFKPRFYSALSNRVQWNG